MLDNLNQFMCIEPKTRDPLQDLKSNPDSMASTKHPIEPNQTPKN